jgi:hypothetical protein
MNKISLRYGNKMSTFIVNNSSDVIPVGTTRVEVANKKIEELPPLPIGLTKLYCYGCKSLRELPPLPVSLTELYCYGCTSLRELPPLLHCVGLYFLGCSDCTSLRVLPPLSHCVDLTELYCYGCTSLRKLPPLPVSLTEFGCSGHTSLLYLPIIPDTCNYHGPLLPTEEKYFEQANMKKNQEFVASCGDALLYRIVGKDITDVVKGYLS